MVLLSMGAIVSSIAYSYKPLGKIYDITDNYDNKLSIHVYCTDATTSTNKPTVWILSSQAHGVPDHYSHQRSLNLNGFKTCTYDQPGFGFSRYPLSPSVNGAMDYLSYLDNLIIATGEKNPVVFMGKVGGDKI
jgi:hypothetical protein